MNGIFYFSRKRNVLQQFFDRAPRTAHAARHTRAHGRIGIILLVSSKILHCTILHNFRCKNILASLSLLVYNKAMINTMNIK